MHPAAPPALAGGRQEILSSGFYLSSLDSFFSARLRQWGKPKGYKDVRGYAVTCNCWMVETFMGFAEPLPDMGCGAKGLPVSGWKGWGRSQLLGI